MEEQLKILVAEDNPDDTKLLQWAFSKAGVEVPISFVCDGQETIEYLEGTKPYDDRTASPLPTLLLLDLKMPRLGGFEVLGWLREQARFSKLLVVVLSSSGEPVDRSRACALGAHAYLVKPSDPRELVKMVKELENYWISHNATPECALG